MVKHKRKFKETQFHTARGDTMTTTEFTDTVTSKHPPASSGLGNAPGIAFQVLVAAASIATILGFVIMIL